MTGQSAIRLAGRAMCVATLAWLCGCHLTPPPRYQSTWRRVTARSYHSAQPYCHGFTSTQWNRWPDECQPQEFIIVEELPLPLPPPPTLAPAPLPIPDQAQPTPRLDRESEEPSSPQEPTVPETTSPDRLIVPQGYTPRATAEPVDAPQETVEAPLEAAESPSAKAPSSWTARLKRFASEVAKIR